MSKLEYPADYVDKIICGDCIEVMKGMEKNSVDAIVTDPPYGLCFMGKDWDKALPPKEWLIEAMRVLKPGASIMVMGGTRMFHRMAVMIEDAGFIIKDTLCWLYGSGFPKAQDLGKLIDKRGGDPAEWGGFKIGGIKPAWEPIIWAVKPPDGAWIDNVLKWGVGAVNVDECRIGLEGMEIHKTPAKSGLGKKGIYGKSTIEELTGKDLVRYTSKGRFPANVIHDGSDEVVGLFPDSDGCQPHKINSKNDKYEGWGSITNKHGEEVGYSGKGSAARFFYCAKASRSERNEGCKDLTPKNATELTGRKEGSKGLSGSIEHCNSTNPFANGGSVEPSRNHHPTVKPIALMEYIIKLVTRSGQVVLDPFCGSGSTGCAASKCGREFIGIEINPDYCKIAEDRLRQGVL